MPNLEVLVSPQDLIALRSIYGRQKHIEESFHVHMEANVHVQQFQRYLLIVIKPQASWGICGGRLFYFFSIFFYYVIICNVWDTMTQKESTG